MAGRAKPRSEPLVSTSIADNHLALGFRHDLHVIGRAVTAIGHLHHPRFGIRGRGARLFLLATCALLVFSRRARSASSSRIRSCAAAMRASRSRAARPCSALRTICPRRGLLQAQHAIGLRALVPLPAVLPAACADGTTPLRPMPAPAARPAPAYQAAPAPPAPAKQPRWPTAGPEAPCDQAGSPTECGSSSTRRHSQR